MRGGVADRRIAAERASRPRPRSAGHAAQRRRQAENAVRRLCRLGCEANRQFEDGRGELQPADHLPRVDEASQLGREAHLKALLGQLDCIPVAQLSSAEQVNAAVFRTVLENALIEARFRTWEMPFNSDSSFWTYLDVRDPLDSAADYRRYIARMRDIPRYFDEQIANMRAGLARGFSVPRATLAGPRCLDRHLRRSRRRRRPVLRGVQDDAFDHPRSRAAGAARAKVSRRSSRRSSPAYREAAGLLPQRISAAGADHGLGARPARRRRFLSRADPRIYDARHEP